MSENLKFEKMKSKYIEENELNFNRVYLSEEENKNMTDRYKRTSVEDIPELLKEYGFYYESDLDKYTFYKKEPCDVDEKMLYQHMFLNLNEKIDAANSKLNTVKGMLIFVLIILCIPILLFLMTQIFGL